jgi:hypothetical protein
VTVPEFGVFRSDQDIATQGQFEPTRDRGAIDGPDHRDRQGFELCENALIEGKCLDQLSRVALQQSVELQQIAAGREGSALAGDNDSPQRRSAAS